jgi:hypothetical protein
MRWVSRHHMQLSNAASGLLTMNNSTAALGARCMRFSDDFVVCTKAPYPCRICRQANYHGRLSRSEFHDGQVPLNASGSCSWCWYS